MHNASLYSAALAEFRSIYSSEVVDRLADREIRAVHDYQDHAGSVPLPATLSMMLGERIGAQQSGARSKLYSPFPFPWRTEKGGLADDFAVAAWETLSQEPGQPFYRFEYNNDHATLRYAVADRMRASCVDCHNSHIQSPKTDWQQGDLRGVLEIVYPLSAPAALSQHALMKPFWLLGIVGLGSAGVLLIVLRRLRVLPSELATRARRSERRRRGLERQLQQAQKLDTIGTLAGGIAHDFNNLLTPISGHLQIALDTLPQDSELREGLRDAALAAERARGVVKRILTFSRQEDKELESVDIHDVVNEVFALLRASIPSNVEFKLDVGKDLKTVLADPIQMHQVVMNIGANAAQAMKGGGELKISIDMIQVGAEAASQQTGLKEDEYVRIRFKDSGSGMDKATLARIFEPFFTTKAVDEGTGLGLSVVHGIVQSHGGEIMVSSEPGIGTVVDVFLPAQNELELQRASPLALNDERGSETVMVVDDEEMIGRLLSRTLSRFGYEVVSFDKPLEALEAFRSDPNRFQIVISDQTMPRMTGPELGLELRRIDPSIPIIAMSGYHDTTPQARESGLKISEWMMKPVAAPKLANAIRRALDVESESSSNLEA